MFTFLFVETNAVNLFVGFLGFFVFVFWWFFFGGGCGFLKDILVFKTVIKGIFIFHVRVYPPVQLIEYECERRVHEFYSIKS